MDIKHAKVLVTGGSSGIGMETARCLVAAGAQVAICGRNFERLNAAASAIGALPIRADVSIEAEVVRMVRTVIREFEDFNVLVNNAAVGHFAPLLSIEVEPFSRLIATNLYGAMLVARESARYFAQRKSGNIINVGSTAAGKGFAGGTAYVASKFGLSGMTECWRAELRKHNIRVMQVNPSEVLTQFAAAAGIQQSPSERKLRPTEIAHLILSLLQMDDRGFVTDATVWATNPD